MVELPFSVPYLCKKIGKQNGLALRTQGAPKWGERIHRPKVYLAPKQI